MPGKTMRNTHLVIAFLAAFFILVQAVLSRQLVWEPLQKTIRGKSSFTEMVEAVSNNYVSDELPGKNRFITLSGLFARITGRRNYNNVTLMANGMLTGETSTEFNIHVDADSAAAVKALSDSLKKDGIPLLFVQTPVKEPLNEDLLPAGLQKSNNDTADLVLSFLDGAGVSTMDLRPAFSATGKNIEKYFYRTDAHWNADGAMEAYRAILLQIEKLTGRTLELSTAEEQYWQRYEKENWWLGSQGKRVGPLFGGLDSLIWYEPVSEQDITCAIPSQNKLGSGSFKEACMLAKYIDLQDLFTFSNYRIYGSNYPMVNYRNRLAANDLRVLLVGDSFSIPIKAFMSTAFTEVDSIDPRYYTASSIAQYAAWTKPDIVILMRRVPTEEELWGGEMDYHFSNNAGWEEIHTEEQLVVSASEDSRHTAKVNVPLEPGRTYRVFFNRVTVTEGEARGVSVLLYEKTSKKVIWSSIMDIDYYRTRGGFEWHFTVPDEKSEKKQYELRLCPGVYGHTEGTGILCEGIKVSVDRQAGQ